MIESPIVVHVPHASLLIPEKYRADYLLSDADMEIELLNMTDRYCDELFDFAETRVVAPISRLVCDTERFREDENEPMAAVGMGAAYTKTCFGRPLRVLTQARKDEILREIYDRHHSRLTEAVSVKLNACGRCLILDGHSFRAVPLPNEQDSSRPDFCIGSDDFHTPDALVRRLTEYIASCGCSVCVNAPFAGSLVPLRYYRRDTRVISVMIEINRGLYMDEQGRKTKEFDRVKSIAYGICQCCKRF